MAIVIHLDRLLVEKKIKLTDLADRVGITLANLSILKTNKAKAIRFSTLESLCRELNCQPKDLLEYVGVLLINPMGQTPTVIQDLKNSK